MKERLLKIMRNRITASIIYILLGLCLVLMPVTTVYIIYKVVFGIVMITVGLYQIYFYLKDGSGATLLNMFSGSILVVLGGFLFSNPQIVVKLLPLLLGTFVLVDSIWFLQAAVRMKKNNLSAWAFVMTGSLIIVVLGIIAMINPFQEVKYTIFFSGGVLLGNGVADVIYLILIRYWKKTIPSGGETLTDAGEENIQKASGEKAASESAESASVRLSAGNAGTALVQPSVESGAASSVQPSVESGAASSVRPAAESGAVSSVQLAAESGAASSDRASVESSETSSSAVSDEDEKNSSKTSSGEGTGAFLKNVFRRNGGASGNVKAEDSRQPEEAGNRLSDTARDSAGDPGPDLTLDPGIFSRDEEDKKEKEVLEEWKD